MALGSHPHRRHRELRRCTGPALFLALLAVSASAQVLEPRLYRNAPLGLNAIVVGYTYSRGNVQLDPSLPIQGVEGHSSLMPIGYVRTIGLFGRSAKVDVVVPVSWGHFEGFLEGAFRTRDLGGIGDPSVRLAVNLAGAPALDAKDFGSYRQGTILGASFQVQAPIGSYQSDQLLNLGTNRWMFRPEVAVSHQTGAWFFELAATVWFFSDNTDFFGGNLLEQQHLSAIKGYVIHSFGRRGLWVAANFGYGTGGKTLVNGEPKNTYQKNWRFGLTASIPLARRHHLRAFVFSGVRQRVGTDDDVFGLAYQFTWMGD